MEFHQAIDRAIKEKKLYFVGDALPPDWYAAFKVWSKLTADGDMKALFNMAYCYRMGEGVEQNLLLAQEAYLKCHQYGDERAFAEHAAVTQQIQEIEQSRRRHLEKQRERDEQMREQSEFFKKEKDAWNFLLERTRPGLEILDKFQKLCLEAMPTYEGNNGRRNEEKVRQARALLESVTLERDLWVRDALSFLNYTARVVSKKEQKSDVRELGGHQVITTGNYTTVHPRYERSVTTEITYDVRIEMNGESDGIWQVYPTSEKTSYGGFHGAVSNPEVSSMKLMEPRGIRVYFLPSAECEYLPTFPYYSYNSNDWPKSLPRDRVHSVLRCEDFFDPENKRYGDRGPSVEFRVIVVTPLPTVINIPKRTKTISTSSNGCFVLTACFNDENHPVVGDFRRFRDERLVRYGFGKALIEAYYRHGPSAARWVSDKPMLKKALRGVFQLMRPLLRRF